MIRRTLLAAALLAAASVSVQAMPPAAAGASDAPPGATIKGEVLESQSVQNYTYLRLKTSKGETWAAVPMSTALKKGQQVTLINAIEMENFESKTLKRKFDRILFAGIDGPNAKAAPAASAHGAAPKSIVPVPKLAKAAGTDGRTIAEVVAGKAALKDKTVTIHAQVVKVSSGILGKNWLHLQDGSGSAASGNHDIVVTTTDNAAVGDIVNASGIVHTDVDLGSGYKYAVLVEGAKLRK